VCLVVCLAACAQQDMANVVDQQATPADLGTPSVGKDLAPGPIGCAGVANCALSCNMDIACDTACYLRATPKGKTLTDALAVCITQVCTKVDGGLGRCTTYPGDVSLDCQACVYNTALGWPGTSPCTPANDPACNRCGTQAQACLQDQ
jgi:hypothetical protein